MSILITVSQAMKFFIPTLFSMLFRINGLGVKSRKSAVLGMTIVVLLGLGFPIVLIRSIGYEAFKQLTLPILLLANCSIFLFSSDGFLKTCYLHLSQVNIVFWLGTAVGAIRRIFNWSYPMNALCLLAVCIAFYFLSMRYAVKPMRFMADNIRTGWCTLLAVPLCTLFCGVAISIYLSIEPHNAPFLLLLLISLLELGFVLYAAGLYRSMLQIAELERERLQQKMLEAQIQAYDDYLAVAKQNRHDLRHHNALLMEYLSSGDLAGAKEYLSEYDGELRDTALTEYCKNTVANAVLRHTARRAKQAGIALTVRAEVPKEIHIEPPELGALFSNLLENACEACEGSGDPFPFLLMTAEIEDGRLKIEVHNTVGGETLFAENGLPKSTKPVGGIGTRSVDRIVKKYGGMLAFRRDGDVFIAQVLLPLE